MMAFSVNKKVAAEFWAALLIVFVAGVIYSGSFGHVWTYDDFPVIVENSDIQSLKSFWDNHRPGRPLRELTYWFDNKLFGMEPAGWHVQNILWHAANAFLLFLLALRLGLSRWRSLLVALIFLCHPLQVEVVANISHRKDSLTTFFCLAAFLSYLDVFRHSKLSWIKLVLTLSFWFLACLAKQPALLLPLAFLVYEYCFLDRSQRLLGRSPLISSGLVALAGVAGLAYLFFAPSGQGLMTSMQSILMSKANYMGPFAPGIYLQTIVKSWVVMASKLAWPLGLAPEYVVPIPAGWTDPWLLAAALLLVFFIWALYKSWCCCRPVFWGLCWAVLFLGPVSNIIPLAYLAADRYLYLPLVGLALAFVAAIPAATPRVPGALVAVTLLVCLAGLSWQQVKVWKNPETLWTQAVKVSPESAFALNNLGNVYYQKKDWNQAVIYYQKAVQVNPSNPMAHYNLGIIFEQAGQVKQAIQHYREFLRFDIPMYRRESQQLRLRLKERYGVWIGS